MNITGKILPIGKVIGDSAACYKTYHQELLQRRTSMPHSVGRDNNYYSKSNQHHNSTILCQNESSQLPAAHFGAQLDSLIQQDSEILSIKPSLLLHDRTDPCTSFLLERMLASGHSSTSVQRRLFPSPQIDTVQKRRRIESEQILSTANGVPKRRHVIEPDEVKSESSKCIPQNDCNSMKSEEEREEEREEEEWCEMFSRLMEYQRKYNTINVEKQNDSQLHAWVQHQMQQRSVLRDDRRQTLEGIGVQWKQTTRSSWMEMYQRLLKYKEKHNTTRVPHSYKEDPKLAKWVKRMRVPGRCPKKYVNLLTKIGFEWKINKRYDWMEMYQRLIEYKNKHGSTLIPRNYAEDSDLGKWVFIQRIDCRTKEKRDLLNAIGFVWAKRDIAWDKMYLRLVEYKKRYNTLYIPRSHQETELGRWVRSQRYSCKREDRRQRLDEIGFIWDEL